MQQEEEVQNLRVACLRIGMGPGNFCNTCQAKLDSQQGCCRDRRALTPNLAASRGDCLDRLAFRLSFRACKG